MTTEPAPSPEYGAEALRQLGSANATQVVFAGGGTGGHLYPAIAVATEIRRRCPDARFTIFGTQRAIDGKILTGLECQVIRQRLRPFSPLPWRWWGIYSSLRHAERACAEAFETDRPDLVVGTGGMASVPAIREAVRRGIPTAIFNPDAKPGRANRHLGRRVDLVIAQFEDSRAFFGRNVKLDVLGCPIRPAFRAASRADGIARFGLESGRRTILVTGASQGARSVNDAILAIISFLAAATDWQLLHLTGDQDYARIANAINGKLVQGVVLAYTENMADALAAADIVISRAGASTLAEITALGRASILMPYPYHGDQHQRANAECLARSGAALIVDDAVDPAKNAPRLQRALELLMNDASAREKMALAARRLGHPDAASVIADRLLELSKVRA